MDGRCISQNELAQRWQISEATLERWRSQRKDHQFFRLGGQVKGWRFSVPTKTIQKHSFRQCSRADATGSLTGAGYFGGKTATAGQHDVVHTERSPRSLA